jgi:hypothetical protein
MDLFNGPVGSNQVHDFSPGIPPSGLFWTQPINQDDVEVHLGKGVATVRVRNLPEEDAHTLFNALEGVGSRVPSTVSFDMTWTGSTPLTEVTNQAEGFTGSFMYSTVAIQWSASQAGFNFVSDPAATSVYGVMGRERNGIFFGG